MRQIKGVFGLLFIIGCISYLASNILIILSSNFFIPKECIEYNTYCSYSSSTSGITTGGNVVLGSTRIYIDCEDRGIYPYQIIEEKKCIKYDT